jgi:ribosomal protein L7Ae-like RNA K-turn-binding protein
VSDPVLGLIGIARKGGHLVIGREAVRQTLRKGRVRVLVVASDAGEALIREMGHLSNGGEPPLVPGPPRELIGRICGRNEVSVVAITDTGLAAAVIRSAAASGTQSAR